MCGLTSFHESNFRAVKRRYHVFRVFHSAVRTIHVLLFCCRTIDEVFSAAANQKPFANNDLCTRKSVKANFKKG